MHSGKSCARVCLAQLRLSEDLRDGLAQRSRIPRLDQQTALAVLDYLRNTNQLGRNDGQAHGHRFEQDGWQGIAIDVVGIPEIIEHGKSGIPTNSVEMTGKPTAIASSRTVGKASRSSW